MEQHLDEHGALKFEGQALLADWTFWAGGKEMGHNVFNLKRAPATPAAPAPAAAPAPVAKPAVAAPHAKH